MSEWQPIDTAPMNKTMVALIHANGGYVRYGIGWYMPLAGWQAWESGFHPTHWTPLPDPPATIKEAKT